MGDLIKQHIRVLQVVRRLLRGILLYVLITIDDKRREGSREQASLTGPSISTISTQQNNSMWAHKYEDTIHIILYSPYGGTVMAFGLIYIERP